MILILMKFIGWKNRWKCFDYDAAYKTPYGATPLRIIFNKVDGYTKKYDKTKYLALFHSKRFERIFDRIRYLIMLKSNNS